MSSDWIGRSIAHYRVTAKLGEGGMGEVWRARDTRLDRDVAIKVLPQAFVDDPERLARFEREAKMLAQLHHPNIASIFGIEEERGVRALAMELVEGPTLADRLEPGALPTEEALAIARQLAEALEEAHDKGIIHRDLKPQNIKASVEGKVKVLDFGLAKAMDPAASGTASASELAKSPTLTLGATVHGVILGTAAYMAPEQARGLPVDKRADIWAFGVVLFEMLSGRRLFEGELVSDVLAGVLRQEIDWSALPESTPPAVRRLLRRCLERQPKNRLHDIADARIVIDEVLSGRLVDVAPSVAVAAMPEPARNRGVLVGAAAAALVVGLVGGALFSRRSLPAEEPVMRFPLALPSGWRVADTDYPSLAISRDGMLRAVAATDQEGARAILVGSLSEADWRRLPGTDDARAPFFSPDAAWIGYFTGTELRRVAVAGGPPLTITSGVNDIRGGVWTTTGKVVFGPDAAAALFVVPVEGGEPKELTSLDPKRQERTHRWPELLPESGTVLFTSDTTETTEYYDDANIEAVNLASGERKVVLRGASQARFLPPSTLVFARGGTLFAQPFDPQRLEVSGSPVPALQQVGTEVSTGAVQFALSAEGSIFWMPGSARSAWSSLTWVDRKGTREPVTLAAVQRAQIALSPDGKRLASVSGDARTVDIWSEDLERGTRTRITFEGQVGDPTWSPDGKRIAYDRNAISAATVAGASSAPDIYWRAADGSGEAEPLVSDPDIDYLGSFSHDGRFLAYERWKANSSNGDIWVAELQGERKSWAFAAGPTAEFHPAISPDGRWMAYVSVDSGQPEIYVRPFPSGPGRWQISNAGGLEPTWSSDGRTLFFRDRGWLYETSVDGRSGFIAGRVERLVDKLRLGQNPRTYSVSPDGERFLLLPQTATDQELDRLSLALHWDRAVKLLLEGKR